MTEHATAPPITAHLVRILHEARERTLRLIEPVSDRDLTIQHDPLMSPIIWDLGHIARFEELWLTRNVHGRVEFAEMPGMYNPFEHPRATRGALPLPGRAEALALLADVRTRVLATLDELDVHGDDPLLHDGYVVAMVAQHEYQHGETILQTLQLKTGEPYRAPRMERTLPAPLDIDCRAMVRFPGGTIPIGTDDRTAAYDNERPRHLVRLEPFWIDVAPVTNAQFAFFIADGGYARRELWSEAGWAWREAEHVVAPRYWMRVDGVWHARAFDRVGPVHPRKPVCHVSFHEAEAYARWAGKRLPSELEWEAAAAWDPATGRARHYPWGDEPPTADHANLDQLHFDTTPVGTFAPNVSPIGCYGMLGDVWEWTASHFAPYPGFESFPYPEYSAVFFGTEYRVLRGGSFATRPGAVRNTFRNWDYPIRRQIFSGFRCARDA